MVWTRHSDCDSGDAGTGHVTQDKPLSSLCERRLGSEQLLTRNVLCARQRLRGTGSRGGDLEWYRQQVIKRFLMKLRVYLGFAAHHKREMRILNRVLTWRFSEAECAEMITHERDTRHVDLLFRDCGLEHAKNTFACAFLPTDQARSFKKPTHEKHAGRWCSRR